MCTKSLTASPAAQSRFFLQALVVGCKVRLRSLVIIVSVDVFRNRLLQSVQVSVYVIAIFVTLSFGSINATFFFFLLKSGVIGLHRDSKVFTFFAIVYLKYSTILLAILGIDFFKF